MISEYMKNWKENKGTNPVAVNTPSTQIVVLIYTKENQAEIVDSKSEGRNNRS